MPVITYIEFNGQEHEVDVDSGISLMDAAVSNGVPGIDADCGGACACATCHIMIEPEWMDKVGARHASEEGMLALAVDVTDSSRLACQVVVSDALNGLRVTMPESQF